MVVEACTKYSQFNPETAKGFDKQCLTSFLPTEYSIGENWLKLLVEDIPEEDISEEDIS